MDVQILLWAIGGGITIIITLLAVVWGYILRSNSVIFGFIGEVKGELRQELDKMNEAFEKHEERDRQDHDIFDARYARKDEVADLKRDLNSIRTDMSTQFTGVHTQMGGLGTQLSQIFSLITSDRNKI